MGNNAMPARVTAAKMKGPKPNVRSLDIRQSENGGYTVDHRYDQPNDGPYIESETHVFPDAAGMHAHVQKLFPATPRGNVQEPGEQA